MSKAKETAQPNIRHHGKIGIEKEAMMPSKKDK